MLKISGKLVTVKDCKTKKDRQYKKLQLMCNGSQDNIRIEIVKDYQNRDYSKLLGSDVNLDVFAFPWVGKQGIPSIDYVMI